MIKGIQVILHEKIKIGVDEFNAPIFRDVVSRVDNVLVSPATTDDINSGMNLYGKKASYTLAIPKGDMHDWVNAEVEFFNRRWRTIGIPLEGIDENIPLFWNKKVTVEMYE